MEVRLAYGREDGIDGDDPDRHSLDLRGRDVAAPELGVELGREARLGVVERGEMQLGVDDLEIRGDLEVTRRDLAGALCVERDGAGAVAQGPEADLLDVEEELGRVLLHAGDGRELVLHLVDAHGDDGGAFERAEEDAAERVAHRRPVARVERLGDEARVLLSLVFDGELGDDLFRLLGREPQRVKGFVEGHEVRHLPSGSSTR